MLQGVSFISDAEDGSSDYGSDCSGRVCYSSRVKARRRSYEPVECTIGECDAAWLSSSENAQGKITLRVQAYAASDTGLHRESNEDSYIVDDELKLYAVTDGMGGHAAGEVAAEKALGFAADYIRERRAMLRNANEAPDGHFRILQAVEDALEEASLQLYSLGGSDPELAGMGTTMTMLLVVGNKGIMSHVGDSRLYLLRDNKLHLLSSDHTLANEMLQVGGMTSEEANKSRYAHILTRSIGQQEAVQVESLLFDLFPGDVCLLCSDGLSRYMESPDQVTRLLREERLDSVPQKLIEFANLRGGVDNITAVVLKVEAGTGEKCPDPEKLQQCLQVMRSVFLFEGPIAQPSHSSHQHCDVLRLPAGRANDRCWTGLQRHLYHFEWTFFRRR